MEEKKRRQGGKGEGPKLDIGGVYLKLFHVALALCSASGASYHYEDKRMLAEIILSFGPRGGRHRRNGSTTKRKAMGVVLIRGLFIYLLEIDSDCFILLLHDPPP